MPYTFNVKQRNPEHKNPIIPGVHLVQQVVFPDGRGSFREAYTRPEFVAHGIDYNFVQDNVSISKKGVVRGLHISVPPFEQAKLVYVVRGSVLDVIVDARKNSPTFGKYAMYKLSDKNNLMVVIPVGCLHGFGALEDDTIFSYKVNNFYNKDASRTVNWLDPTLNINWGIAADQAILSPQDQNAMDWNTFIADNGHLFSLQH